MAARPASDKQPQGSANVNVLQVNAGFIPGFIEGHNGTYMDRFEVAFDKLRANITLHSDEGDIQGEQTRLAHYGTHLPSPSI